MAVISLKKHGGAKKKMHSITNHRVFMRMKKELKKQYAFV
jgi:hypothetical protein